MGEGYYKTIDELQLPKGDYVLALPGWYPTWLDSLPGDFNQRHIKAASLFVPQVVLYVGKDQTGVLTKTEVKYKQLTESVVEILVVYPAQKLKAFDVLHSHLQFAKLLFQHANLILQKWGKPLLLHSYIVMRGGLAGFLLGKKWKLPFVLTENWTIYYPADPGYLQKRNAIFRSLVKKVFGDVKHFLPVTKNLYNQVEKQLGFVPHTVVPNVVETGIFTFSENIPIGNKFRFLHVSTMIYQKNPEGLLRAFKIFSNQNPGVQLYMVGPYPNEVLDYYKQLQFAEDAVVFTGSVSYEKVAGFIKSSNALVLFSRYENLPCVILESFCCGNPVIATRVGGIDEVITEGNGILIDSEDELALVQAMHTMVSGYNQYDRQNISKQAISKYSYDAVGRQIYTVCQEVL